MATLIELATMPDNTNWGTFVSKVQAAVVVKAAAVIADGTATVAIKEWAIGALSGPTAVANTIVFAVIGANATATTTQIFGATDVNIQTAVNNAVNALYGGV